MINEPEDIDDEILTDLARTSELIAEKVDASDLHAVFSIATKFVESENGEETVQTFLMATGFLGVLGEGLYAELKDQIENGNTNLFAVLRDVVRDLEEDLNIDPDENFGEDDAAPTLH